MIDLAEIRKKGRKKKEKEEVAEPSKMKKKEAPGKKKPTKARSGKKTEASEPAPKPSTSKKERVEKKETTPASVPPPEPIPFEEIEESAPLPAEETEELVLDGNIEYCLTFSIRNERCAIAIEDILEIISILPITPVPNAPEEIKGIISLRGTVVPVTDLGMLLGHKDTAITEDSKIIVIKKEEEFVGFLVDRVSRTLPINLDKLEKPPVTGEHAGFLKGLYNYDKKIIMLLDGEKLT